MEDQKQRYWGIVVLSAIFIAVMTLALLINLIPLAGLGLTVESLSVVQRSIWITVGLVFLAAIGVIVFVYLTLIKPLSNLTVALKTVTPGKADVLVETLVPLGKGSTAEAVLSRVLAEHFAQLNEKIFWHENILDAIPFPLSITDMNMNWTFINKPVETFLGVKRDKVVGHQCSEWNASICNTEKCGIARLRKTFTQTFFDQQGGNFQVDTSYLYNTRGEKVGHIEAVQDISRAVAPARFQEKAVDDLSNALGELAQGRLNFSVADLEKGNDFTRAVRENFVRINASLEKARLMLRQTVGEVSRHAGSVNQASDQLAQASDQAGRVTSQIAATIQQIAKGTGQQSTAVGKAAEVMEVVNQTVSSVANGSKNQAEAVRMVSDVAGYITMKGGISEKVDLAAKKVAEMGARSEEIGLIVETIEDVASQTNMLALNAAIEAVRAGEHGKGFAVVADEVRKLAERSSSSTKEISKLIKNIQASVQEAVQMTTLTAQEINKASSDLESAIESVAGVVEENSKATHQLIANTGEVMQSMENIASAGEENSAATEEVSASAEQMTAQVEELSASAQSLAEMAVALKKAVDRFQI